MNPIRKTLGLLIATTLFVMFGGLLLQAGTPSAQASDAAVTRLGWMGGCYPPVQAVGRYFPGDAPCRPSQTVTLEQLSAALSAHGILEPGETLRYAPHGARALTCWGVVLDRGQAAGWICSDRAGLYRTGMDGRLASSHWLLRSDGAWTEAEG